MRPWLFFAGDWGIPSYWALLMIGYSAALYFAWREARRDGVDPNVLLDLGLLMLLVGIIGARLMHVLAEDDPLQPGRPILLYYLDHPLDVFKLWNGLAFYGGLLLALPAGLLFMRWRKMPAGKVADIAAVAIPLGLVFGRCGCFLAGCCHGVPTDLPWGVSFENPACLARPLGVPLHPTQLYSAGAAALLVVMLLVQKRCWKRYDGQVFLSFLALYSAARFGIEFLRGDNRGMFFSGALSASQLIALPVFAVALVWMLVVGFRMRRRAGSDGA
ncbi:MAG: prolipoprotein diacylglyceryl transferase [Deltaproteobacteria bacterium]|nr:prolipoprotein diacylglyceryl transferase [Deltaproteobacteria bacterium]